MEGASAPGLPRPLSAWATTIAEIRTSGAAVASEVGHRGDDVRLLTGRGRFVADELPRGALHMAIVRSPLAHAEIARVDVGPALAAPGVRAAYSGAELAAALRPFPGVVRTCSAVPSGRRGARAVRRGAGRRRARGQPVRGRGRLRARPRRLRRAGRRGRPAGGDGARTAPQLHPEHEGGNVAWSRRYVYGSPDEAFAAADRVVGVETTFPRYNSTPLEPYGVVADWDRRAGELTVRANFQGPFSLHPVLCAALGLELNQVRLIVPDDIGGSFGIKAMIYPYIALAAVASRFAGSPVVWLEDRQEHFYGSASGTNRVTHVEAAVTADGIVLGLRYRILEDVGAYLRAPEPSCVMRSLTMFAGPYRVPHGDVAVDVVMTNKLPTGLNRGYGGQQHIFTLERVMDAVARDLGLEPDEVRRRNLIDAQEFPFETASGTRYDSGDYGAALELVLERSGYRERRRRSRDLGDHWIGVGLATAVHSSAANMGYVDAGARARRPRAGRLPPEVGCAGDRHGARRPGREGHGRDPRARAAGRGTGGRWPGSSPRSSSCRPGTSGRSTGSTRRPASGASRPGRSRAGSRSWSGTRWHSRPRRSSASSSSWRPPGSRCRWRTSTGARVAPSSRPRRGRSR